MQNPYLDEYTRLKSEAEKRHTHSFLASANFWHYREKMTKSFSWAIPTEEAIKAIAELEPIVEIGAGTGYWGWLLRQCGAHVKLYDRKPKKNYWIEGMWTGVIEGTERNAKRYPDHALMLCWPLYDHPMAFKCLERYKGDTVIYVGESYGGCTADDAFHKMLGERFAQVTEIEIPRWYGIKDAVEIWKRK